MKSEINKTVQSYQEHIKNVYERAFKYTIDGKEVTKEDFYKYLKLHMSAPYGMTTKMFHVKH